MNVDAVASAFRTGAWATAAVWIASYARDTLVAFAGSDTNVTMAINLIARIQWDRWAAWGVGAVGVGYGLYQRRLKRRSIERLTVRPAELEHVMDHKRSSSKLRADGQTRPEDR